LSPAAGWTRCPKSAAAGHIAVVGLLEDVDRAVVLKIHSVAIDCCAAVGRVANDVARQDSSLADQLRRAMASVALNISEGSYSQGRNRNARYFNAMGSAAEVSTALEVAKAFGYGSEVDAKLVDGLDRIRATLWRILHR
jgi:four helix bundle protein